MILFILATIGMTNIIVHGAIFDDDHLKLRSWALARLGKVGDLFTCYECTGWWSGLIMGCTLFDWHPTTSIPCAFAGAALGHLYTLLTNLIESNIAYEISGDEDGQSETTP